jgi:hypothetical protein
MKNRYLLGLFMATSFVSVSAQTDSLPPEETIDFSQFENATVDNSIKRYCTSKISGLSPNKLISIGYDWQGNHQLENSDFTSTGTAQIHAAAGLRIAANVPVISNTRWLLSLGATYWRIDYDMNKSNTNHYFINQLSEKGLTTTGLNATLFKPLNEKRFVLAAVSADANGTYRLNSSNLGKYLVQPKVTLALFYGWKRTDKSMLAFGISRTYRPGAKGFIPLVLFNHTFEQRKWGVEALFPARAALRRTINTRTLFFLGYELEGNSYSVINTTSPVNPLYNNLELRRSEIRPRITFERALYQFIWLSVQAGYRINYNFNIDQQDKLRLLGSDEAYYMTNTLTNPLYFQIGIHLVSP